MSQQKVSTRHSISLAITRVTSSTVLEIKNYDNFNKLCMCGSTLDSVTIKVKEPGALTHVADTGEVRSKNKGQ
jgi:hypothetical protein